MSNDIKINGIVYKEIEKVSEGSFGFISVVKPKDPVLFCKKYSYKANGSKIHIALKRMVAIGREKVDLAKKEVKFLKTYSNHSNPYFVRYFDSLEKTNVSKNEGEFYILMEYRDKGTLWDLIATKFEKKEYFEEEMILK
jgi:serine/threonine protein kinase